MNYFLCHKSCKKQIKFNAKIGTPEQNIGNFILKKTL